jgi:hypothetical protein
MQIHNYGLILKTNAIWHINFKLIVFWKEMLGNMVIHWNIYIQYVWPFVIIKWKLFSFETIVNYIVQVALFFVQTYFVIFTTHFTNFIHFHSSLFNWTSCSTCKQFPYVLTSTKTTQICNLHTFLKDNWLACLKKS